MFEFLASLAWWEWIILIPCTIIAGWVIFSAIMYTIAMAVVSFLTNERFAGWVTTIVIFGAFLGIGLIVARHL